MMKKTAIVVAFLLLISLIVLGVFLKQKGMLSIVTPKNLSGVTPAIKNPLKNGSKDETGMNLKVSDGYSISIFASGLDTPRDLNLDPNGNLLVSITSQGKILKLPEKNVVVENLNRPHGIAFHDNKLYVAETNQVAVFNYDLNTQKATNKKKVLDLPSGGNHFTRSIVFNNNKLFVSTGSSCNVCEESDERRAAIWFSNPDGSDFKPFAKGLRNSVFMTIHPQTKDLWATDMGRDLIGDDVPPEEVNIVKEGNFYGWPYCYGNKVTDNQMNSNNSKYDCGKSTAPHLTFQAHSAPLGLSFLGNDLLVSYHGSWNRTIPTGYKVVRFPLDKNGNPKGDHQDFVSGWLDGKESTGRPADVLVKSDNEIYISDDKAGVVYLVKQ